MEQALADASAWIENAGAWAYLMAPLVMTVVAILPVPAEFAAILNGVIFGPWIGSAITWAGALAGAWISFEVSRKYGRPTVSRWMSPVALARVDRVSLDAGWWGLLVLRLIPWVAFTALNWGLGLGGVSRRRFVWTTAVGIAPGAVVFTSTGAGLGYLWGRIDLAGWLSLGFAVIVIALAFRAWRRTEG